MPAQFVEKYADYGFDGTTSPPYLLVETGWYNYARLRVTGNGQGWKLTSANRGVATARFTSAPQRSGGFCFLDVQVDAKGKGTTYITATGGANNRDTASLEVDVTDGRHVYVNFHFVTDGKGVRTRRSGADAQILVDNTTRIYEWQANTYWYLYQTQDVKIPLDFTTPNQSEAAQDKIWAAMSKAARKLDGHASHFNLFCVRTWGARDKTNSDVIGTNLTGGNLGIFEDKTDHLTVAHELGHGLSLRHRDNVAKALMYYKDDDGKKIFKDEVRKICLPDRWASWG